MQHATRFLTDVWAIREDGKKVYPYRLVRGPKKGCFDVSLTGKTDEFRPMSEQQLIAAITSGAFAVRGTVRMLPLDTKANDQRNAYLPTYYRGQVIRDTYR